MKYSDGITTDTPRESAVEAAITQFFEDKLEEELIGLRWDNAFMREQLMSKEDREISTAVEQCRKAAAA